MCFHRTAEDINREIGMLLCCVTHRLGDFLYCYLSLVLYFIFIPSSVLPPSHFRFMYLCERVFKILKKNRILTRHSVKTDGPIDCDIGRSWVHVTTRVLAVFLWWFCALSSPHSFHFAAVWSSVIQQNIILNIRSCLRYKYAVHNLCVFVRETVGTKLCLFSK